MKQVLKVLSNVEEFRKLVSINEIVLVGFIGRDYATKRYMINLFQKLESRVGHLVNFALFDIDNLPSNTTFKEDEGINTLPLIRLYLKGKNVLEQEDCFKDMQTDYYVLKLSMRNTLQQYGIKLTLRLGLKD
ncbi:MAG: hypothetical protein N3G48_00575 [Sulfolobales archaeon]|nr:hypothetical protein [Sulfolobales archaeon]